MRASHADCDASHSSGVIPCSRSTSSREVPTSNCADTAANCSSVSLALPATEVSIPERPSLDDARPLPRHPHPRPHLLRLLHPPPLPYPPRLPRHLISARKRSASAASSMTFFVQCWFACRNSAI